MVGNWELMLLLTKFATYAAVSSCVGSILMQTLRSKQLRTTDTKLEAFDVWLSSWFLKWAGLGLVISLLQLPIQAGAMAENGLAGMFDPLMLSIMLQSAVGSQVSFIVVGFTLLLLSEWGINKLARFKTILRIVTVTGFILLAISFTFTGHTVELNTVFKGLLVLHILAMAAWAGSLWPLHQSCKALPADSLVTLMENFGKVAVFFVSILIACGVLLLLQLVEPISNLFTTNYGQLLMLKLIFVSGMLLLAAWHKLKLVAELAQHKNAQPLRLSILIETLLVVSVLVTTSVFTTLVGPQS